MNGIIEWFARNEVAANLLMLVIVVLGFYSLDQRLILEVFPDIERNVVNIGAAYRGATPSEVEQAVVLRMEEAIADLTGVDKIYSDALEGSARLRVELTRDVKPRDALDDIKARIDAISTFPNDVERPVVSLLEIRREVISVVVAGELNERELRRLAEQVRDELTQLPGVTQVEMTGVRPYEISIEIPEATLNALGLTLAQVGQAIRNSSQDVPAGTLRTSGGEILLRSLGQAYRAEEFGRITVISRNDGSRVKLGEIATIRDGFTEDPLYARFNGRPAVTLDVYRVGDQSAIEVAATVKDYLKAKQATMPGGIELSYWRDRSQTVQNRVDLLLRNALHGGIIVFLLLGLFLQPLVAFWVMLGIPVAFLGALAVIADLGVTLNLVSLFAFILVLGIVVDDAIVTGDSIFKRLRKGEAPLDAAIRGTQEIAVPVTFGVLTTVAAFIPLLVIAGDRGALFAQIPLVVIPVLLFSLIESKLILPAHMKHVRNQRATDRLNALQRVQRKVADGMEYTASHLYQPLLGRLLSRPILTLAVFVAVAMIIFSIPKSGRMGFTFFPRVQSEIATATLTLTQGTPVEITERHIARIETLARELQQRHIDPETGKSVIIDILTTVGAGGSSQGTGGGSSHVGQVRFEITPPENRTLKLTSSELVDEWRGLIGPIPGARELTFRSEIGRAGDPVNIQLTGQDFEQLRTAAAEIKTHISEFTGLFDIKDSFDEGKEEVRLALKPGADGLGLSLKDLGDQVRHAFFGFEAQRIQRDRDDVRVMVRYPTEERQSLGNLERMNIRAADGTEIPIGEVADVEIGRGFSTIKRINRDRTVNVTADADKGTVNMPAISADLAEYMPTLMQRYPGVRYSFEGEMREQQESFGSLGWGIGFVLFMIYALLAIPFRSYILPIIVMAVIPFAVAGAILGHLIMGMGLSIMSIMGMLALSGVAVNDSLVMVEFINRARRAGMPLDDAIKTAGVARFRAIWLTSLTTFGGLIPLILEKSTQAQFLIPMAISLGFGILFATLITLLLVPISYRILEQTQQALDIRPRALKTD
ncbi:MAG: efflux RND transporter permease subunit [Thiotrichales bacterium]